MGVDECAVLEATIRFRHSDISHPSPGVCVIGDGS